MNDIYFISDLHLSDDTTVLNQDFLAFIDMLVHEQAAALYILGDLFDYYLGDDISSNTVSLVIKSLSRLVHNGIATYFMPGNRDFLIGSGFIKKATCTYLPDPFLIHLGGRPMVVSHGDMLCTRDWTHQWYRKVSQAACVKRLFLALPYSARQSLAKKIRGVGRAKSIKVDEQQVDDSALFKLLRKFDADTFIHGHTHQPMQRYVTVCGKQFSHLILPDWKNKMTYVRYHRSDNAFTFH